MGRQGSGQNVSTAVMQRRVEAHDSLDDFPTPPWATRALCEWLMLNVHHGGGETRLLSSLTCREPAANRGHMVRPLQEYFPRVLASDVHDYGVGFATGDYLWGALSDWESTDWTITNPPFRLAQQFIERALKLSRVGVAVIVRTSFIEGVDRCNELFLKIPPAYVLQFSERVVMHKGKLRQAGSKYLDADGKEKTASSATSYCWVIWLKGESDTRLRWIPSSRRYLEAPGDYPINEGDE